MKVCGVGTGDQLLAVCFLKKLSLQVRLWLWVGLLGCVANSLLVLPAGAQTIEESVEQRIEIGSDETVGLPDNWDIQSEPQTDLPNLIEPIVSSAPAITQLSEIEQPATTIKEWVAQIEASLVQITGVGVETTEAGLQVILETAEGETLVPETRTIGNALIADIPNAAIAQEFSQANPIEGIALVSVTSLSNNQVQVTITGTDAPPVVELMAEAQGLVLAVTLGDTGEVTEEDTIEIVVKGEQDEGYNPSNTSVGTRTDTPLRDIPQSIQIVPQEVLRDQNVTNFNEAVRNVPGVIATNSISGENALFILRGFSNFDFSNSNILRNGLRRSGGLESQTSPDIERIEVLLGPASVLYGGANPGGTINIVTKQPLRDPFYAVDATIGNYDFYQGTIDLSGPLNDSRTVLYRLNASYQNRGNRGNFIDFARQERFTIAPVVSFALGERTRLIMEGEYINRDALTPPGLPAEGTVLPNPNGHIPRNRFTGNPEGILRIQQPRVGYRFEHQFGENWSLQNAFQFRRETAVTPDEPLRFNEGLRADGRTLDGVLSLPDNRFDS